MGVDVINFEKLLKHSVLNQSEEMDNIEAQLIRILQSHNHQISSQSVIKKTGHARFRRAPVDSCEQVKPVEAKLDTNFVELNKKSSVKVIINSGTGNCSGEEGQGQGSVCNGKPLFSSGKPPLPTSHRKRSREIEVSQGLFGKVSSSGGCHCCQRRRKTTVIKREIKRVTTSGSSKVGADDIPADKYSWKKYHQKLIPGTLFPRGYYKCNSVQGCPARKHVERDSNDPTVLILIYQGQHRHHHHHSSPHHNRRMKMPQSLTRVNNSSGGVGICCC